MSRIVYVLLLSLMMAVPVMPIPCRADAAGDLKAGTQAADGGRHDEAIAAFTRALDSGSLSPDEQVLAARARASAYVAKSLMADAFDRRDEGRRLRGNAVADLTRALQLRTGDAELFAERGYVFQVDAQYAKAAADFDAALKIKRAPMLLMQRATAYRANGDYDRALADYDDAAKSDLKDTGIEPWDISTERGYAEFLAGRFDAATADFTNALTVGVGVHAGDVLWAPYQLAWLHIAAARAGKDDSKTLAAFADKINLDQWPGTLVGFFLGRRSADDLAGPGGHGMGRSRDCNMSFFVGQNALIKGDTAAAERHLRHAGEVCNPHTMTALATGVELARIRR